jgi:hypothetical protein
MVCDVRAVCTLGVARNADDDPSASIMDSVRMVDGEKLSDPRFVRNELGGSLLGTIRI